MELTILGSGSNGNGYILQNNNEALIIECGMPLQDAVTELCGNMQKVVGCLITHSHGDHARYIDQYARPFHIFATEGTLKEKKVHDSEFHYHSVPMLREFKVGNFIIKAFATEHDTAQPCGFIVYHPDFGTMLFATDTHHLRYKFKIQFDYILIECNHIDSLVDRSIENHLIPRKVGVRAKATHMSLKRCIDFLDSCELYKTKAIILLHISKNNGNPELFITAVRKATGKPVYAASKGMELQML